MKKKTKQKKPNKTKQKPKKPQTYSRLINQEEKKKRKISKYFDRYQKYGILRLNIKIGCLKTAKIQKTKDIKYAKIK